MFKQMLLSAAVMAFGLVGPATAQEPAKQTRHEQPQPSVVQVQHDKPTPLFAANFDRAARTQLPPPLAPGSAEVP
jgi:hypothetical protein